MGETPKGVCVNKEYLIMRYYELQDKKWQSIEEDVGKGRAKSNQKQIRDEAGGLYTLLRNHTYQVIGLGNSFRRIARDFSGLDGSNWRSNRHLSDWKLRALARILYRTNPYDVSTIIRVETCLEEMYTRSLVNDKGGRQWRRRDLRQREVS